MIGVYLLKKEGKVVYVGQSINVERRLKEHKNKDFDNYQIIECEKELLRSSEESYILLYNPIYNKKKVEINTRVVKAKKDYEVYTLKFTKKERELLNEAAKAADTLVSRLIRYGAIKKAKKILKKTKQKD